MKPSRNRDGNRPRRPGGRARTTARKHSPAVTAAGDEWLYGRHAVIAAFRNPQRRLHRLLLTHEAGARDAGTALSPPGSTHAVAPEIVTSAEIATLLPEGAVHQGYAAYVRRLPGRTLEDLLSRLDGTDRAAVLVLDQVTDPRNVGAILRSAAAFGAAAVILPERHGADTTAALAKAASGALETVDLIRVTNITRSLETLKKAGVWCIGLDARAPTELADTDLSGRIALVLGSEGAGLRRLVAEHCDLLARLPITPAMESLNVSAAAAIALYETVRRR